MTVELLYKATGNSCGRFQIYHSVVTQLSRFASAWTLNLMMFGNYEPEWKCSQTRPSNGNITSYALDNCGVNCTVPLLNQSSFIIPFHINGARSSSKESNLSFHNLGLYNASKGFNGQCNSLDVCDVIEFDSSSKTIVSEFGLICDQSFVASIIICVQMVGMFCGVPMSGQLGELCGRKVSVFSCLALCAVSDFLAIFSPTWQVYAAFIFFNGLGTGGILTTSIIYTMEFLEPKWRGRLPGIPIFSMSHTLFAVAIFILRNWVYVHIASALVCTVAFLPVFWAPESLRWLLLHGKEEEARRVVEKIMRINNIKGDSTDVIEKLATFNNGKELDRKYTYMDLFRTRQIRSVTIKASVICFFIILSYYALIFSVKSLSGNFYTNALIASIIEIPFLLVFTGTINRFGRRLTVVLFISLGTLGFFTVIVAHYTISLDVSARIITYSALISKGSAIAYFNGFTVLQVELFPTAVRSLGMAFTSAVGRLGAIMAPYLIPRDQESLVISYIILGLTSLLNIGLILSLPETKGMSLQDRLVTVKEEGLSEKEINRLSDLNNGSTSDKGALTSC